MIEHVERGEGGVRSIGPSLLLGSAVPIFWNLQATPTERSKTELCNQTYHSYNKFPQCPATHSHYFTRYFEVYNIPTKYQHIVKYATVLVYYLLEITSQMNTAVNSAPTKLLSPTESTLVCV